jgi:hypothetical protein
MAQSILTDHLRQRNEASIRYRMRNISFVLEELGISPLSAFSSARQVGTNVKQRIKTLLQNHRLQEVASNDSTSFQGSESVSKDKASQLLDNLDGQLQTLERELIGIGHNNPPEPLFPKGPLRSDFEEARANIAVLKLELAKKEPDLEASSNHSQRLIQFGLKIAAWIGVRATKFTDATLQILAPVAVLQATGVAKEIIAAIKAVSAALSP